MRYIVLTQHTADKIFVINIPVKKGNNGMLQWARHQGQGAKKPPRTLKRLPSAGPVEILEKSLCNILDACEEVSAVTDHSAIVLALQG